MKKQIEEVEWLKPNLTDEERMTAFYETQSYAGETRDWRTMPELGTSPDEPDYEEVMRGVAARKKREKRAALRAARVKTVGRKKRAAR
jgi:hypothetical protein